MTFKLKKFTFREQALSAESFRVGRRVIVRGLAFVRRRARSSLRRRKRVSQPGQPPSVHSKDKFANLKNIRFTWDQTTESGIVGPVFTNQRNQGFNGIFARGTVPKLHEFGGVATIREKQVAGRWVAVGRRRRASYPPRPFIGPASTAEIAAGNFKTQRLGPTRRAA